MGSARYFLLKSGTDWLVTLEGRIMARSPSRAEATDAAIVMADLMGSMHHDADVMVADGGDKPLELIWTYGRDSLPATISGTAAGPPAPDAQQTPRNDAA